MPYDGDSLTEQEINALSYAANSYRHRGSTFTHKSDGERYTILVKKEDRIKLFRYSKLKIIKARAISWETEPVTECQRSYPSDASTDDVFQLITNFNAKFIKNMIAEEDMRTKKLAAQYGDSEPVDYDKIREMINYSVNSSIPVIVEKVIAQLQPKQPTASTTPENTTPESAAPTSTTPGNKTQEYEYEELNWRKRLREFFK